MKWILAIIIYTLTAIIGVTFKKYFCDFIFFPDLITVSMFCFCFSPESRFYFIKSKEINCLMYGLFGGLVYDCFSMNIFGESLLSYGITAIFASRVKKKAESVFLLSLGLYLMIFFTRFFIYKEFGFHYFFTIFFVSMANAILYLVIEKKFLRKKIKRRLIY